MFFPFSSALAFWCATSQWLLHNTVFFRSLFIIFQHRAKIVVIIITSLASKKKNNYLYLNNIFKTILSFFFLCQNELCSYLKYIILICLIMLYYTLSGRLGSALAWHTHGLVFKPRLLQQVLRFVACIYTVQYVALRGTAHECGGATSKLNLPSLNLP